MIEKLKNKFEENYISWKGYIKFVEENNKELSKRQEEFSKRVQNLETKEQIEEYFNLQAEPSKHIYDISILSNNLYELYKLIEDEAEFPEDVKKEMEKVTSFQPYYICKDDKLVKVNEKLHQEMEIKFQQSMQSILNQKQ